MKQFTTPEQTAKLIELGFEKPKSEVKAEQAGDYAWFNPAYSIGELIEMLPKTIEEEIWWGDEKGKIGVWGLVINTLGVEYMWDVSYERAYSCAIYAESNPELIDALYAMLVKLKEEGVI
jgi:hypothetical protein